MVIDGIRSGELQNVNVRVADDLLYSIIEAAIFRLAVLKKQSIASLKDVVALAVRQLAERPMNPP
jgi:hypothetical protein